MDTLSICGMRFRGFHGVHKTERTEGNSFEVDIRFWLDLSLAGASDNLRQTIDYEAAEQIVKPIIEGPSVQLLETLVHHAGTALIDAFDGVKKLQICIKKMNPPLATQTRYTEVCRTWNR